MNTPTGNIVMNSLETLATKIEALAEIQKESVKTTSELTKAVTELLVQSSHFEKLRAEDNHRMDKSDQAIALIRSDIDTKIHCCHEKINTLSNKVNQHIPVIALFTIVCGAALVAVLVK